MTPIPNSKLRDISSFPELITYLADDLDWSIDANDFESYSFDWDAAEDLGIAPEHAAKIKQSKQLRPLVRPSPADCSPPPSPAPIWKAANLSPIEALRR